MSFLHLPRRASTRSFPQPPFTFNRQSILAVDLVALYTGIPGYIPTRDFTNAYTATNQGATIISGAAGQGFQFTGTQRIEVPNAVADALDTEFTMCICWTSDGAGGGGHFFDSRAGSSTGIDFRLGAAGIGTTGAVTLEGGSGPTVATCAAAAPAGLRFAVARGQETGSPTYDVWQDDGDLGSASGTVDFARSATTAKIGNQVNDGDPLGSGLALHWIAFYSRRVSDDVAAQMLEPATRWDLFEEFGRRTYFIPAAAAGLTTNLASKTVSESAQPTGLIAAIDALAKAGFAPAVGLVTALDSLAVAEQAQATGHGTALDSLTKAGLTATLSAAGGLTTALDSLTSAGQSAGTGHGTALDSLTKTGLTQTLGAVGALTTNLASLSKAGQAAALGLITTLDSLSITERAQVLGLITSTGTQIVTEYPANIGGAGLTTVLATLSKATLAAGTTVWELGDAIRYAYDDLDTFFAIVGDDFAAVMDSQMGFAESITVGATEVAGIFDDHSAAGGAMEGPLVLLKTADVDGEAIDQGTVLTIRGRTFHVAGVQRDGTGVATVILREPL